MIALWATPAARGFFRGAILQSDPMVRHLLGERGKADGSSTDLLRLRSPTR